MITSSRRSFLKASLAAGAAPWIIPCGVVRAQGARPTPANRVTLAHIGVGNMGTAGLRNHLNNPEAQVVAVCDCFADRRERAASLVDDAYQSKGCQPVRDFRDLLARPDIDAVEIATADHWHVPIALYAVRANKDVYVQKPLGTAMRWAWTLREEVKKRKTVFQYGTQQRSDGRFRLVCELVRNGALGKIQRVETWCHSMASDVGGIFNEGSKLRGFHLDTKPAPVPEALDYDMWLGPAPAKLYTNARVTPHGIYHIYDYALGFIAGWGAHPVDIAQWGLGTDHTAPVTYAGTGRFPDVPGLFDTVASWDVTCTYANGIPMRFMDWSVAQPVVAKYRGPCDHGTTFFGEKGWVSVDRGSMTASNPEWLRLKWGEKDVRLYESRNQWANFVACVKSRQPTVNPIDTAVNGDLISHLSDIAVRTGRTITWDPAKERIVGDAAAEAYLNRVPRLPWKVERA